MKLVRRDILKLIQIYIENTSNFTYFNQNFLPSLQNLVEDYQQNSANARDPEVLFLFATLLRKEGQNLTEFLQTILYSLCETTLEMIKRDYQSYPEFREGFFTLVKNIIVFCIGGLFQMEGNHF